MLNKNDKKPTKLGVKDRKEIGLELRKTHFQLGNDNSNFNTQYRKDYIEAESKNSKPIHDNVALRKTHFVFGDHMLQYNTTAKDQNKLIDSGRPRSVATLDANVKNDLRRCHFTLGNFVPGYQSTARSEFFDKSGINANGGNDYKEIGKSLRSHNYVLGNTMPDYKSEAGARFVVPKAYERSSQKTSTAELQKSHYTFGTNQASWTTTSQANFYPKNNQVKKYTQDLKSHSFVLGDERPNFTSINSEIFVKHPVDPSVAHNKNLAEDLRKHHFNIGNDFGGDSMVSMNHQDYQGRQIPDNVKAEQKVSNALLRKSNFALGDKNQESKDHYNSTYTNTMQPKVSKAEKVDNVNFISSIAIKGKDGNSYQSEARANFIPKKAYQSEEEKTKVKSLINDIKGVHYKLGENLPDFRSTNAVAFTFDKNKASNSKATLDQELIKDLRSTHYKLGYQESNLASSTHSAFIPFYGARPNTVGVTNLKKSSVNLHPSNVGYEQKTTIYMQDYVKKEIVD